MYLFVTNAGQRGDDSLKACAQQAKVNCLLETEVPEGKTSHGC